MISITIGLYLALSYTLWFLLFIGNRPSHFGKALWLFAPIALPTMGVIMMIAKLKKLRGEI